MGIVSAVQLMNVDQVANVLCMGVSTVWAKSKELKEFPKPISISARQTRWLHSEVEDYVRSKVDCRDAAKMN